MKPNVRIKGYADAWKRVFLHDCLEISTEVNCHDVYGKNDVLSVSDDFGVVNQIQHLGRSYAGKSVSGYKILSPGQIVYTKSPLRDKPFGIIKENNFKAGIVSVLYAVYNVKSGIYSKYIQRYFDPKERINKYLLPLVNKGAKNTMNISDEMALNGEISIPTNIEEQKAICDFFDNIDTLIDKANANLASLKQVKEASLQAMFPQEGETVPKVRFKGFEGEWKKVKLEDCLFVNNQKNIKEEYDKNDVLSVSDDFGICNQIDLLGRSYAGVSVANYGIVKTGDIVYTKSPLKSKPFGIIKANHGKSGIVSTLYAVYTPCENTRAKYIELYFELPQRMNKYIHPLVNKGAKNDMKVSSENALKGYIMIPNLSEQQKIASYFTALDRRISLQTQRLEKLKQIKAACLDKMFV